MTSYREKEKQSILALVERKRSVEEKMYTLRFDTTISDEEKNLYLKQLADDIIQYESQVLEELKVSTDQFYDQLNLKAIGLEYLTEERKKVTSVSTVSSKSTPALSKTKSSRTSSRTGSSRTEDTGFSLLKVISGFFSSEPEEQVAPSSSRDLVVLEDEVAKLRAGVVSLKRKKNLSKAQQRELQELQDQLKIRAAQKAKISREEYVDNAQNIYTDD